MLAVQEGANAAQLAFVAGAAAQVAAQVREDFLVGRVGVFAKQRDGIHDEAGVAKAALLGALVGDEADEFRRFLLQAFECVHAAAVGARRERGARKHGFVVHEHGAQTAARGLAAALHAEAAMRAHEIDEERVGGNVVGNHVSVQLDFDFHYSTSFRARSARRVSTGTSARRYSALPHMLPETVTAPAA